MTRTVVAPEFYVISDQSLLCIKSMLSILQSRQEKQQLTNYYQHLEHVDISRIPLSSGDIADQRDWYHTFPTERERDILYPTGKKIFLRISSLTTTLDHHSLMRKQVGPRRSKSTEPVSPRISRHPFASQQIVK